MGKFYELKLNCARVEEIPPAPYGEYSYKDGFIEILPEKHLYTVKGLFGDKQVWKTVYIGKAYIIAEKVDDYFEEIIFGKKITYKKGIGKVTQADEESLKKQLNDELSCYYYTEISNKSVTDFINAMKQDNNILIKYKQELTDVESKRFVKEELARREKIKKDILEDNKKTDLAIAEFRKTLKK